MPAAPAPKLIREVVHWRPPPPGDKHKRLGIPKEALRVSELAAMGLPVLVLQTQVEPGLITLRPGALWEQEILPQIQAAVADDSDDSAFLLIDRYERISLGTDPRLTLTLEVVAHLGISYDQPHIIYFEAKPRLIKIMSQAYRNRRLIRPPQNPEFFI